MQGQLRPTEGMANTVGLLRFPDEWRGAMNCLSKYYDCKPSTLQEKSSAWDEQAVSWKGAGGAPGFCICGYCDYCDEYNGSRYNGPRVFRKARNPYQGASSAHSNVPNDQKWKNIIAPYVNVAADNPWSAQVLSDCSRKLSALDPDTGLGVLHGLLLVSDNATLFESFLELGVDPDTPFIHSDTNKYTGLSNFNLTTAKQLNYGTAAHFAAFFERNDCLQLLVDVGAEFMVKTQDGKTPLDLAKNAASDIIMGNTGAKTLAQLAKEGKFFALRYKMRSGRANPADLHVQHDGKTVMEWVWTKMAEWQFAMKMDQDSLMAFKVMAELRYRYDIDAANVGPPPAFKVATGVAISEFKDLVEEVRKVRESQQTILESICILSGEIKKLKIPHGGTDSGR